jgi:4-hydroxybutyrate CoA-transferase
MICSQPKKITAQEAAGMVQSGNLIITGHSSASPRAFIKAMIARKNQLRNVWITHVRVEGPAEYMSPDCSDSFFHNAFMLGPNSRQAMLEGRADYIPNRFGQMPEFMRNGRLKPDIVVVQLSPPDSYGYCSYGICTSYLPTAAKVAKITIGEINDQIPLTFGSRIHISDLDYVVHASYPLYQTPQPEIGEVEYAIGRNVAGLIEDGATLQLGIGAIPNAVLSSLKGHKDIGIHSEMIGNGVVDLMVDGVINGRKKSIHPFKVVCTFAMGDNHLFNFLDNCSAVEFHEVSYTNAPKIISQNCKMVAINSAIEVDVTGQVCAESIGTRLFTGTGGQLDFALGASIAGDGKFIIAIPSTASRGRVSRITPYLAKGAAVTTPRTLADYVVTEFGIAELKGKNLRQRAKALINICHPEFREEVEKQALQRDDIHF